MDCMTTEVIGKGKGQGKRNIFLHFAADGDPLGDMPATAALSKASHLKANPAAGPKREKSHRGRLPPPPAVLEIGKGSDIPADRKPFFRKKKKKGAFGGGAGGSSASKAMKVVGSGAGQGAVGSKAGAFDVVCATLEAKGVHSLVDIGCGQGRLLMHVNRLCPHVREYTGVDTHRASLLRGGRVLAQRPFEAAFVPRGAILDAQLLVNGLFLPLMKTSS
ncbi:hypothetical protein T484DRAFT_1792770 [Baffinella frigidus]|nr:hypothetical protein T484DRAFT_1792770 [Cryptophyta sp. CCMP2293]